MIWLRVERRNIARRTTAGSLVACLVSGILLSVVYTPRPFGSSGGSLVTALTTVHRLATVVLAAAIAFALLNLDPTRRRKVALCAAIAVYLALMGTGADLAWRQLALWGVTVGTNIRGVWDIGFSDEVRSIFADGAEVSSSRYGITVLVHTLALPVALIASLTGVLWPTETSAEVSERELDDEVADVDPVSGELSDAEIAEIYSPPGNVTSTETSLPNKHSLTGEK